MENDGCRSHFLSWFFNHSDFPPQLSELHSHHLRLLAHSHLTEVDGEDGVWAGALSIHLGAGCGPGESTKFQTLQQLQSRHTHTHTMWRTFIYDHRKRFWVPFYFAGSPKWLAGFWAHFWFGIFVFLYSPSLHTLEASKHKLFLLCLLSHLLLSRSFTSTLPSPPSPCYFFPFPPTCLCCCLMFGYFNPQLVCPQSYFSSQRPIRLFCFVTSFKGKQQYTQLHYLL